MLTVIDGDYQGMPRDQGYEKTEIKRCDPCNDRSVRFSRYAGTYPFRPMDQSSVKDEQRVIAKFGVKTHYIERGSPWQSGYNESVDGNSGTNTEQEDLFCL